MILAAYGVGLSVAGWLRLNGFSRLSQHFLTWLLGSGLLGLVIAFTFMVKISRPAIIAILAVFAGLTAIWLFRHIRKIRLRNLAVIPPELMVFGGFCLLMMLLALLPPSAGDVLSCHLDIPQRWLQEGNIYFVADHRFGGIPALMYSWNLIALSLGAISAPALFHLFFTFSAGLLIYEFVRCHFSRRAAVYALFIFAATPQTVQLSVSPFVDIPTMTYVLASFLCIYPLAEEKQEQLIFSALAGGIFLGFACCTKTNALIFCPVWAASLFFFHCRRTAWHKLLLACLLGGLGVLAIAGPMYFRTWWWTGNPFYPALPKILKPFFPSAPQYSVMPEVSNKSLFNGLLLWWNLSVAPYRIVPSLKQAFVFPMMSFLPLSAIVAGCLAFRNLFKQLAPAFLTVLAFYALTYIVGAASGRYYAPVNGIMAIPAGVAAAELMRNGKAFRFFFGLSLLAMAGITLAYLGAMLICFLPVYGGPAAAENFLTHKTINYDAHSWLNRNTPEDAVVGLTCSNAFYLKRRQFKISRATEFRDMEFTSLDDWKRALNRYHCSYVLLREFEYENKIHAPYPLVDYLKENADLCVILTGGVQGRWGNVVRENSEQIYIYRLR